jgi:hypothetical protein
VESALRISLEQTALRLRFSQMVAEEPYAREAKALLRRLSVFRGPFRRQAINAVAPETMSFETREASFYTLRRWGFILRTPNKCHKRFYMPEHIEQVVPPDKHAADKHFMFYWYGSDERKTSVFYLSKPRYLRWEAQNILRALQWGLDHHPQATFQRISDLDRFIVASLPREVRPLLINIIEQAAQHRHHNYDERDSLYRIVLNKIRAVIGVVQAPYYREQIDLLSQRLKAWSDEGR